MPQEPTDQDPTVKAADITSRRTLFGVIITAVIGLGVAISPALLNKCNGPTPAISSFIGRVSDKNTEERIKGAKVSLETESLPSVAYTDTEGVFSFPVADPGRELRLRIEAERYQKYDIRVTPAKNQGLQDIRLIPSTEEMADLSGRVIDSNDKPIQGAKATLDDILPPLQPAETSSDGVFTIKNIPRKYGEMVRLRIAAQGFQPDPYTEDLVLGKTPPRIRLKRKP